MGAGRLATRDERGWMTLWILGLCVMLLFVGGISLDLWRAFSERRSLAAAADAGARAGASLIDERAYRDRGELTLVAHDAEAKACESVAAQADRRSIRGCTAHAYPDHVDVEVTGRVDLTITKVLRPNDPIEIRVTATATPHH